MCKCLMMFDMFFLSIVGEFRSCLLCQLKPQIINTQSEKTDKDILSEKCPTEEFFGF